MVKKVASYMKEYDMAHKGDHICVGVSGGADSVCLFLVLYELQDLFGFTMSVVHVEHGLRGASSLADMEFVRGLAAKYGIAFTKESFAVREIAVKEGCSVEEAGRHVRYQAFERERERFRREAADKGGSVKTAVAHHADDNAETALFHMCRGSGVAGMAGMHPVRGEIIRPLLCVTRKEIEAFLTKRGQDYRTDATNADLCYSRNRIRSLVMPELTKINGACVEHINLLAGDMLEIDSYLESQAAEILEKYTEQTADGPVVFRKEGLVGLPAFLQKRVLLRLIARAAGGSKDITREHANALHWLAQGQSGKQISLPYGLTAKNSYDMLLLSSDAKNEKQEAFVEVDLKDTAGTIRILNGTLVYRTFEIPKKDVKIPKNLYTKWFDYDKIKNRLSLRTRKSGDYLMLEPEGHRQKLKRYLMNEKVPGHMRGRIPLLADGSHILWAVGYRISAYYKITEHTKRVLEVQFMEEKA